MLTFERWVCSHLRAVRNRDGFTFALFRFADDVYSSEDFLLQAQVELFNFHTRWKVWAVLKVFFLSGPFRLNNRCNRSAESRILHGRAQNFHRWVSLPRILFSRQLPRGGPGDEKYKHCTTLNT